jgi:hypothetical protein
LINQSIHILAGQYACQASQHGSGTVCQPIRHAANAYTLNVQRPQVAYPEAGYGYANPRQLGNEKGVGAYQGNLKKGG